MEKIKLNNDDYKKYLSVVSYWYDEVGELRFAGTEGEELRKKRDNCRDMLYRIYSAVNRNDGFTQDQINCLVLLEEMKRAYVRRDE